MKRIIRITASRRRTIRLSQGTFSVDCPVCCCRVEIMPAAQAAAVLEIDINTLNRFLVEGRIHAIETVSGSRQICINSLFKTR